MIVRHEPVKQVDWGNGTSARYVVQRDGLGYGLNATVVYRGTSSKLQYQNHVESVLCVSGYGWVTEKDGPRHEIRPGMLYILDDHDAHTLEAGTSSDLHVICVFTPGLNGNEVHKLTDDGYSGF